MLGGHSLSARQTTCSAIARRALMGISGVMEEPDSKAVDGGSSSFHLRYDLRILASYDAKIRPP